MFPSQCIAAASLCPPQQVDLKGAIQAGIPFCKAANGVVLSEGPIPTRFVRRVKVSAGAALAGLLACARRWIGLRRWQCIAAALPPQRHADCVPSCPCPLHAPAPCMPLSRLLPRSCATCPSRGRMKCPTAIGCWQRSRPELVVGGRWKQATGISLS